MSSKLSPFIPMVVSSPWEWSRLGSGERKRVLLDVDFQLGFEFEPGQAWLGPTLPTRANSLTLLWFKLALPNLRQIFASFRSPLEEREYSRTAFFKLVGWLLISMTMR